MPSSKNIILVAIFGFVIHSTWASQPSKLFSWEWFISWFTSIEQPIIPANKQAFKQAITASNITGKPLDLAKLYAEKEEKSILNAEKSAENFKKAIEKSATNNLSIMQRFEGNHKKFLFGASSSAYQYEGGLDSNNANAIFYKSKELETAGIAIDFWNRYKTDIPQMKSELGINSFRISIAWERVQPSKDVWDISVITKYVDIIRTLQNNHIEPIVVLQHYTIPQWFAEIGGFEKYENINYFVAFVKKMYVALHMDVTYWSTFNAIEGYAFKGYYTLDGPPGKQKSLLKTEEVMYNMVSAHAASYKVIKKLHKQYSISEQTVPTPHIGIQKNIMPLDPADESYSTKLVTNIGNRLQNKMIFSLLYNRHYKALDWIGINIYSNKFMVRTTPQEEKDEERKTANLNYRDYPEGIYRAVKIVYDTIAQPLNIPIIITENGIATQNDDAGNEKRTRFFRRALYTIRKLIEEGYPIIGYTPWASHDNYEWPSKVQTDPYDRPYGMFNVNFDKNSPDYLKRTLKKGAEYYRDFIQHYFTE